MRKAALCSIGYHDHGKKAVHRGTFEKDHFWMKTNYGLGQSPCQQLKTGFAPGGGGVEADGKWVTGTGWDVFVVDTQW